MRPFLPLFAAGAAASAMAATNDVAELPSVVVVASPITQTERVSKDGVETVALSRSQLGALNAQDLQTALRQVPGVTISRYSAIGSYGGGQGGSVYVRGAGTARPGGEVRAYTDGAPRESGVWGHPLMDSLPIDFAEGIVVQKNPHPAARAGTFGAVEVETRRRREQGAEAEVDLVCGRYNTFISSGAAGLKDGPVDAYGGMSYKHSDGSRDHNTSILKSAFGRVGLDLGEHERVAFIYQRTDSRVQDPGEIGKATPLLDRFDLATDLYNFRFDTERDDLRGFSLAYAELGTIHWHKDHLTDGVATSPAGVADTFWFSWGTRHRYEWNVWRNLWLVGAFDAASEGGSTRNTVQATGKVPFQKRGRLVSCAPYLGARYEFELNDDWTLTPSAGTRYHFHSVYDGEWAPGAALSLDWRESLSFFATGSRGVHYPGVYVRAVSDDFARGTLEAEIMDYASGGVKWSWDDATDVLLCVFHSDVKNRIDKTATGYLNSGSMRATGVELSAHWRPLESLSFFGGGTFTNPETSPVSRLPRWTFVVGGTWKICKYLTWSLDGQYIGEMNAYSVRAEADRANLRELGEAFVFNTRFAVPLESFTPMKGEVFVSLENFTDQDYEYYPGYPMGGAFWYVGCKLKF